MVRFGRGLIQAAYLVAMVALAGLAFAVGPVYTFVVELLYILWSLVHRFFTGCSRVVGMASATFLSHMLTKSGAFPFGGGYTISAVLGRNDNAYKLSRVGVALVRALSVIEKDHCLKAARKAGLL